VVSHRHSRAWHWACCALPASPSPFGRPTQVRSSQVKSSRPAFHICRGYSHQLWPGRGGVDVGADVSVLLAASHLDTSADPHPHLSRPTTSLNGGRWWYPTSDTNGPQNWGGRHDRPLSSAIGRAIGADRPLSEAIGRATGAIGLLIGAIGALVDTWLVRVWWLRVRRVKSFRLLL